MSENLAIPGKLKKTGLLLPQRLSYEEWAETGELLKKIEGSMQWWIGDWCNFGEANYGEKYSQALDITEYSYQTIANAAWVCKAVDFSRRREELSFAHHSEVANLPPKRQEKWLQKAIDENWARNQLRDALNNGKESAGNTLTKKATCPKCGHKFEV